MFSSLVYQLSSTAIKNGFRNIADSISLQNIKELDSLLDDAYQDWTEYSKIHGIPETKFRLISGYRCNDLNQYLGGSKSSAHLIGSAADIAISNEAYWHEFCHWAADFAQRLALADKLFDQIIIEQSGSLHWIHFSTKGIGGSQQMQGIRVVEDKKYSTIIYGAQMTYGATQLTENPVQVEHELNHRVSSFEIEGEKGKIQMNLSVMHGSYMRCIYIIKRLQKSLGFSIEQAAGVVGHLLRETEGRLHTTHKDKEKAGICGWGLSDQILYRKIFANDEKIETGNLMNQTSFLIRQLSTMKVDERLRKIKKYTDAADCFFQFYQNRGIQIDFSDTSLKQIASYGRAYAKSALDVYNNYVTKYDDNWLVGYYSGNGVHDGNPVEKGDDIRLWNSRFQGDFVTAEEIARIKENHLNSFLGDEEPPVTNYSELENGNHSIF